MAYINTIHKLLTTVLQTKPLRPKLLHDSLVMEEATFFKTFSQLNQLLREMIHFLKALETPHAGQNGVNTTKTPSNMHRNLCTVYDRNTFYQNKSLCTEAEISNH